LSSPPPTPVAEIETRFTLANGDKRRPSFRLSASKDNKRNLSSSERERREEERRRNERKDDVVIGKTSAKRDAVDFPIDTDATEREFLLRASREERLVHEFTEKGMNAVKSLRLELADKCFDKVFELRPDAYLWQAGIVKFYLDDVAGASAIFARSALHFETKFGPMGMGPASEERIWRSAAELKHFNSLKKSARKRYTLDKQEGKPLPIAQIPERSVGDDVDGDASVAFETRKVFRLTNELFDAAVDQQISLEVVARAKLLSVAENDPSRRIGGLGGSRLSPDVKKRKINACYFLALYYDVTGDIAESKRWIKAAFKLCTNAGKSADITDTLPLLHMTARDWFDDDPYDDEEEDDEDLGEGSDAGGAQLASGYHKRGSDGAPPERAGEHMSDAYSDPILEASIMKGVEKMKFDDIREALQIRGISVTGSKETLKERLFISLMDDAGYQSGFAP